MQAPNTRPSLILRLRNLQDVHAWSEFVEVYEPLVYRLACQLGMQHADALEAKQEVMLHLAKVVKSWQPTPTGSFRGWLYRVARNVMLQQIKQRSKQPLAAGDSQHHAALSQIPAQGDDAAAFDLEFRRQVFAWAAARVRVEVEPTTWEAFWQTFVQQQPAAAVAEQLGVTRGNVYVARSRVMKRLRELAQRHGDPWHPDHADGDDPIQPSDDRGAQHDA